MLPCSTRSLAACRATRISAKVSMCRTITLIGADFVTARRGHLRSDQRRAQACESPVQSGDRQVKPAIAANRKALHIPALKIARLPPMQMHGPVFPRGGAHSPRASPENCEPAQQQAFPIAVALKHSARAPMASLQTVRPQAAW